MKRTRKGFTLVELLIVIVVIGILSAMMMLSSNEATTTARANNITSNLRNLKTAGLAYYTDNMNGSFDNDSVKKGMFEYLSGKTEIPDSSDYAVVINDGKWYIMYTFPKKMASLSRVKTKVAGRTKTLGLLKSNTNKFDGEFTANDGEVALRIR